MPNFSTDVVYAQNLRKFGLVRSRVFDWPAEFMYKTTWVMADSNSGQEYLLAKNDHFWLNMLIFSTYLSSCSNAQL